MTDEDAWKELTSLPCWTPLSGLSAKPTHLADTLYQLSERVFLLAMPYGKDLANDPKKGPFITMTTWAISRRAARRVYLKEKEADDGSTGVPPSYVLPASCEPRYGALLSHASPENHGVCESASYRFPDGAFISKSISAGAWTYYFRSSRISSKEMSFVVERSLS